MWVEVLCREVIGFMRQAARLATGYTILMSFWVFALIGSGPASAQTQGGYADLFDAVWTVVAEQFAGTPKVDWDEVGRRYRDSVATAGSLEEAYLLMQQMVALLGDSGTYLVTPAEVEQARSNSDQSQIIGVGMLLESTPAGEVYIVDVLARGPAARAGVRRGERIVAVDGESTAGQSASEVASRIRGEQGKPVRITLADPQGQERTLEIVRAPVTFRSEFEAKTLPGRVGYISVPTLGSGSELQFLSALRRMYRTDALIVDLRRFDGVADPEAVLKIAGLLTQEPLGAILTRQGAFLLNPIREWGATGSITVPPPTGLDYYRKPVAILVDASVAVSPFSLAFVTGMQETGRATLVGRGTEPGAIYGGGQVYYELPGGGFLSVTANYLASIKSNTFVTQFQPDVPVPVDRSYLAAWYRGDDADVTAATAALSR